MTTKFTESELEQIVQLRQDFMKLAGLRGELEFQKEEIEQEIQSINVQRKTLVDTEQALAKQLSATYGPGTLNAETGEFTPAADA